MDLSKINITVASRFNSSVMVDGIRVKGLLGYALSHSLNGDPVLTLKVKPGEVNIEGQAVLQLDANEDPDVKGAEITD